MCAFLTTQDSLIDDILIVNYGDAMGGQAVVLSSYTYFLCVPLSGAFIAFQFCVQQCSYHLGLSLLPLFLVFTSLSYGAGDLFERNST